MRDTSHPSMSRAVIVVAILSALASPPQALAQRTSFDATLPEELSRSKPLGANVPQDVTVYRALANSLALRWNQRAFLIRIDVAGSYSASVFRPRRARFVYATGDATSGLAVRVGDGSIGAADYELKWNVGRRSGVTAQAVPAGILDPQSAVRKLWDLEPSVRGDAVVLQLLRPGIEKPESSAPPEDFCGVLRVPLAGKDVLNGNDASASAFVWRMLAMRHADSGRGGVTARFVTIDALTGKALCAPGPAVRGWDVFDLKLPDTNPIRAMAVPPGEIPMGRGLERPELYDATAARQTGRSIDLMLRGLVRDGRSEAEIRAALDKAERWSVAERAMSAAFRKGGIEAIEAAARREPRNVRLAARLAWHYVGWLEQEQKSVGMNVLGAAYLETTSGTWKFRPVDPRTRGKESAFYRKARELVYAAIAINPKDPEATWQFVRLTFMEYDNGRDPTRIPAVQVAQAANPRGGVPLIYMAKLLMSKEWELRMAAADLRNPISNWYMEDVKDTSGNKTGAKRWAQLINGKADEVPNLALAYELERKAGDLVEACQWTMMGDAMKWEPANVDVYYLLSEGWHGDATTGEHLIRNALMTDPASPGLHALRSQCWQKGSPVATSCQDLGQFFVKLRTSAECASAARQLLKRDPVSAHAAAVQSVSLDVTSPAAHVALAMALIEMSNYYVDGIELIPDALEQAQLECALAACAAGRLIERGGDVAALRTQLTASLLARAQCLGATLRPAEARECLKQLLAIDPTNAAATEELGRLPK